MAGKQIRFSERQVQVMAKYIAQLECEGIAYKVEDYCDGWGVEITGF